MLSIHLAIQNDKDLLLNIMDIFVKEPLLDWKKAAVKQAKHQSKNMSLLLKGQVNDWCILYRN
ncbi:hypothetical protein AB4K20DRAFT_1898534 [Rhizopus microsporus]